jgi:chemotaxis response regulator CheB
MAKKPRTKTKAAAPEASVPSSPPTPGPPPICAIGASAGGVRALQEFFRAISPDLGLSYVVVIHLAPDHPSQLGAILAGRTKMPSSKLNAPSSCNQIAFTSLPQTANW